MTQGTGIRRRVLVVWLVLAVLATGIAFVEYRNRSHLPEGAAETIHGAEGSRMLLPVPFVQLGAIEIGHAGTLHRFERDGTDAWFYHGVHANAQAAHAHQTDPAQALRIDM
jgi:hypothetical protein